MKISTAATLATLGLCLAASPVWAIDSEANKQAPAPQGTTPPESNAKAKVPGAVSDGATKEEMNTQSPGNAEPTDLTKKAESPGVVAPKSKEQKNTEVPAPNNTQAPSKQ